ncbi:XRE family transcriptional regulator [Actinokineospora sp. 24-640]
MDANFSACRCDKWLIRVAGLRPQPPKPLIALISATRRSAEEYVAEDWSAVAAAIKSRSRELGLRQYELSERSQVSQAIIRELENHTVERRRSTRTLEALSIALEWHPGHLAALLHGRTPLKPGERGDPTDEILAHLDAIRDRLESLSERLDAVSADVAQAIGRTGRQDGR